ncbi:MAG: hypothetical protein OER43_05075 [Gammaproteobacteria bacterium]|nr:hypothetical protein [Gammaproteobacteria bacterium]MDH3412276.1 hypothetical protein [Gammaproteobacteria bacterium]
MLSKKYWLIAGLVLAAALLRIFPHPPNFAPVAAMALFAGAQLDNKKLAFLIPLVAMLLSDIVIGFHDGLVLVYVCMCIAVAIGMQLRGRIGSLTVTGGALASSLIFFVVTNFGVWLSSGMYPLSLAGLVACYVAAIPFFHYTIAGDLFYAGVLFGGFALIQTKLPSFRSEPTGV